MICGVGIDLVENSRLEKIIEKWGQKFLTRIFSDQEIQYCGKHIKSSTHYGARFAAKESFLKAMGIGMGMGINLRDIEVVNDDNGKPALALCGEAKAQIERRKITNIHLSLTHTKNYATALVILEKK
jgi:holo-[acyl-carrier protein] synthase